MSCAGTTGSRRSTARRRAAVDAAKTYFLHNLEAMTPRIARAPYLFGERLSVADILLTTCLDWAAASDIALSQNVVTITGGGCAAFRLIKRR